MRGALFLLLLSALLAGCRGHALRMGGCPRVKVLENFDFDKFLGEWYVIQRFNPIATCSKIKIEKDDAGGYKVGETSRFLGINFRSENNPRKPKKISFPRADTEAVFKVHRTLGALSLRSFGVVDTNYDDTAVVWGCDPLFFGSIQNGDILSRKPDTDPDSIKQGRTALESMGIDITPLTDVDQSRCGDRSLSEDDNNNFTVDIKDV